MRAASIYSTVGGTVLALTASLALAAPAFLKFDGVEGEASAPESIEVQSFSWGVSQTSSVGASGAAAGRAVAEGSPRAAAVAPRDAASGQASGRRSRAAAPSEPPAVEPKTGDMATFTVAVRESPTRASTGSSLARACATGKHFSSATLTANGRSYTLHDVVVSSCAVNGEMRTAELKGHVTLIK